MAVNYSTLLAQYQSELSSLQVKLAVQEARINDYCSQLGLENGPGLEDAIKAKRSELEAELKRRTDALDVLVQKYNAL